MISELFENIKVYGRYVRSNGLDGLDYWNKIKKFLSKPEQEIGLNPLDKILGKEWNINVKINQESEPISNLEEIYNYLHDNLKMHGEEGDIETQSIDRTDWEKNHFALQLIRIPKNNSLNLLRLLQVGYNLGQLSAELGLDKTFYSKKFIKYFELNNLVDINSYIMLTEQKKKEISSNVEIQDLITNLNNFIFYTINQAQSGGGHNNIEPFYSENVEDLTINNNDYRRVIFTGKEQQFVLMSINPGDNIPMEVHKEHDQFLRIEEGEGVAIINGIEYKLKNDSAIIVPAGSPHQIINTGSNPLKLYTIYSPPEHSDKLVQSTNPNFNSNPNSNKSVQNINDEDNYKNKYLSYKNKYINLKKNFK
jgi:mannose-6-phosphate isomerase-like protein (cupin superfamily)